MMRISSLDVRLAVRMLGKYPGVTAVGGLAIAFAIAVGAAFFELVTRALAPTLPLPDGERVVALRAWDATTGEVERRVEHDYAAWREGLEDLAEIGAYRTVERNLLAKRDGMPEPIGIAEITASGLRVAGVAPALGRALTEADERADAPRVIVISHAAWQRRFAGDPAILGRNVRLGDDFATVVGVMPEGFGFPYAHDAWVPLPAAQFQQVRRGGPGIEVVARLRNGAPRAALEAEFEAIGARARADHPDTHEHLRAEVVDYAEALLPMRVGLAAIAGVWSLNVLGVLFVMLIFANVAMLMFARAAARENELVVRSAIGASRGRIVMQLFVEALVLGALATAVGLVGAHFGLERVLAMMEGDLGLSLPFWFAGGLSTMTVAYAAALALFGAALAGVLPALKIMGPHLQGRLQRASAGAGGPKFGGVWSFVIVAQVAVTVTFPVALFLTWRDTAQIAGNDPGIPTQDYLAVRIEMDRSVDGTAADPARVARAHAELETRLEALPHVASVAFATELPRMYHPWRRIDVEGVAAPPAYGSGFRVSGASVSADYFDAMQAPLLAGRGFRTTDAMQPAVIVNESFVRNVLGGRNAIGVRFAYVDSDVEFEDRNLYASGEGVRFEIVGVVPDRAMSDGADPGSGAGFYHLLPPGAPAVYAVVQVRGDTRAFIPTVLQVASTIDPSLRLYQVQTLDDVPAAALRSLGFWFGVLAAVSGIALLLSLAGIYAVMSFAVSRRTREIGIRVALGAHRARIVASVFRKPLAQVTLGIVVGAALAAGLAVPALGGRPSVAEGATFLGYAIAMLLVCLLAAIVPTRRALAIEPTAALRQD